jgi:hypothetical protein
VAGDTWARNEGAGMWFEGTSNGVTIENNSPLQPRRGFYRLRDLACQASTVRAIGMWGQNANVTSYPAGYGFVPSAVASAAYTAGGSNRPAVTVRGHVRFKGLVTPI